MRASPDIYSSVNSYLRSYIIIVHSRICKGSKHIDSRYLLVNVIARRAREISIEAETEHIPLEDKPVTIAIHEVADGKLAAVVKE